MFIQIKEKQKNNQNIKLKAHLHYLLKQKNKIENKLILISNRNNRLINKNFINQTKTKKLNNEILKCLANYFIKEINNLTTKEKKLIFLKFFSLMNISKKNPNGFTVNTNSLLPIKKGFAVSIKDTQNCFNEIGLFKVIIYAMNNKNINAFGGWFNDENGKYYFDASLIFEKFEDAFDFGKKNNQIAIYDLNECKEIRI
jgi:fructokinase